jgi:hypothetical protein
MDGLKITQFHSSEVDTYYFKRQSHGIYTSAFSFKYVANIKLLIQKRNFRHVLKYALKVVSSENLGGSKMVLFDGYRPRIVALDIILSI